MVALFLKARDSRPALIFTILERGLRARVPAEGDKPGLGVRVCACEGIDNKKKRKEKIATEKKRLTLRGRLYKTAKRKREHQEEGGGG